MNITPGIKLLEEIHGSGRPAMKGDVVNFRFRLFLNRGEEVALNERQIAQGIPSERIREVDGRQYVVHRIELGKRQAIAGIEESLTGMCEGGYRRVRISAHLAYRDKGIPELIPANAVLVCELMLDGLEGETQVWSGDFITKSPMP